MTRLDPNEMGNCPICGKPLMSLEYGYNHPFHYDGVSEFFCPTPNPKLGAWHYRIGRFSGQILHKGEYDDWRTGTVQKLIHSKKGGKNANIKKNS